MKNSKRGRSLEDTMAESSRPEALLGGAPNASPISFPYAGFAAPASLPTGHIPTAVVAGDFNEDGKIDLAISNGGDNTIYVLLGNGDETFKIPEVLYTNGQSPVWLTAARLRPTGHLDLIAVDADSKQVEVLSGNGDGTFQASTTVATLPQAPSYVLAGDFNGDGQLDLAVGLIVDAFSTEPQFEILLGDGTAAFPSTIVPPSIDNPFDSPVPTNWLSAGDINNDGKLDLVATVSFSGAIAYINKGGATGFDQGPGFGPVDGAVTVVLADMDNDGCLDAVEAGGYGLLTIAKGICTGEFSQPSAVAELGDADVAVVVTDVDGDGHPDVIASSAFSDNGFTPGTVGAFGGYFVSVLKGDGKGNLSTPAIYRVSTDAYSLAVADFKGDNRPGIVTTGQIESTANILSNDGSGNFGVPSGEAIGYTSGVINAPIPGSRPQSIDLNGDGKLDVVLMESGVNSTLPSEITTLLNDGTGKFLKPIRSPISVGPTTPYPLFVAGSFRTPSSADLIYTYQYTAGATVAFFPATGGGSFGTPVAVGTVPNPFQIVSGDFNGDHKLDFAIWGYAGPGAPSMNELDVFLGNGDGTFTHLSPQVFAPLTDANPQQLIAGDFNHDGKLDLLIGSNTNGGWVTSGDDLDLAIGNGDGTFQAPTTLMSHFGPVVAIDVNRDGYLDLIQARDPEQNVTDQALLGSGAVIAPAITIYLGGPGTTFQKAGTYYAPGVQDPSMDPPLVGDFNGDGNLDVALLYLPTLYSPPWENRLQLFQGVGDGTFKVIGITYQLPAYDRPAAGGDYRGAGVTDLLDLVGFTSAISTISAAPAPPLLITPDAPLLGNAGSATVTLAFPAESPTTVQLSSSDPAVELPASLTFGLGESQASLQFTLGTGYDSTHVLALQAGLAGHIATAYVSKVNPNFTPSVTAFIYTNSHQITQTGVSPGEGAHLILILQSVNGYSGVFEGFSCNGLPAGASCDFAQSSVVLSPGSAVQVVFDLSTSASTPEGTYPLQIQFSDGVLLSAAQFTLGVGGFGLNLDPSTVIVNGINPPASTLTTTYVDGFGETLQITCSGLPTGASCLAGVLYPANTSTTVDMALTSPSALAAKDYPFQIVAAANMLTQSVNAILRVTNFSATLDKTSGTVSSGHPASFNITLTSLNHFSNGNISIICQGPANLSCSTPSTYSPLAEDGTSTVQLTLSYNGSIVATERRHSLPFNWNNIATCLTLLTIPLWARRRRWWRAFGVFVATGLLISMAACGGGGAGGSNGGSGAGGPPGGGNSTASVTVVAQANTSSGNIQQSAGTITVTIAH